MAHIGNPKRVVQGVPKPIIAPQFAPVQKPQEVPVEERELVPAKLPQKTTQQLNRTLLRSGWYEV